MNKMVTEYRPEEPKPVAVEFEERVTGSGYVIGGARVGAGFMPGDRVKVRIEKVHG